MSTETQKPNVNIGTIGHVDHGKTTLTAAITNVLNKYFSGSTKAMQYADIDNAPEEKARGITINQRTVRYETAKNTYSHVDCPGHADYVKNMITGASQMDRAILVVSAADGLSQQTKEHILLAEQIGIKEIAVFFTKADMVAEEDQWIIEEVQNEVYAYLDAHGFKGPYITAVGAPVKVLNGTSEEKEKQEKIILDFFAKLDELPIPDRNYNAPFLMSIDHVHSISGRGTVITGCVERGTLLPNSTVEIVGGGSKPFNTTITGIQAFHKDLPSARAGDNVGLLLRGVEASNLTRGMVVCTPGSTTCHQKVKINFLLLSKEDGGRATPIYSGYRPQCHIRCGDFTAVITLLDANGQETTSQAAAMMTPGDTAPVILTFEEKIPLEKELRITIREGGKTVGAGIVLEILE